MDLCDEITGWSAIDGALHAAGGLIGEWVGGYGWIIELGVGVLLLLVLGVVAGMIFTERSARGGDKLLALGLLILLYFMGAILGHSAGLSYAGFVCH